MYMTWIDNNLQWNSSDYNGVNILKAMSDTIWHPNIAQHNRYIMFNPIQLDPFGHSYSSQNAATQIMITWKSMIQRCAVLNLAAESRVGRNFSSPPDVYATIGTGRTSDLIVRSRWAIGCSPETN